jgi:Domain of unknown function (DUF4267)
MAGWTIAVLVVVALVGIGVGGLLSPRRAGVEFGVALDDPRAAGLVRAMAVRDLAIGAVLAVLVVARERELAGLAMWLVVVIPVADLLVVRADRRAAPHAMRDRATLVHAAGAVGLAVAGGVLLAGW